MSSLDVVASLLRSAARTAKSQLTTSALARSARARLRDLSIGRAAISDDDLTRAVARLPDVSAATVRSGHGCLRIDIGFVDGNALRMTLYPDAIAFAAGGAKELSFRVEPRELAARPMASDVIGALVSELAHGLFRPALAGAPVSMHSAFVHSEGERAVVDVRSVPAVRWALQHPLRAAIVEAMQPRSWSANAGQVEFQLGLLMRL